MRHSVKQQYDILKTLATSQQNNLPLLPVPSLEHTAMMLRNSVKGIVH